MKHAGDQRTSDLRAAVDNVCTGLTLLRADPARPSRPVIDTAGALQNRLVDWLTAIGPLPPLVVLVALLVGTTLLARQRRKARR